MFSKKDTLKNLEKFTGKHLCQSLFLNKVPGLFQETLAQVLSCEFGETFKNNIFYRAPTVAGFPLPEAVANQTSNFYKKYNTGQN